jgi:hypothetical protein
MLTLDSNELLNVPLEFGKESNILKRMLEISIQIFEMDRNWEISSYLDCYEIKINIGNVTVC